MPKDYNPFSRRFVVFICILFGVSHSFQAHAQKVPHLEASIFSTVSADDFQAYWLVTNQHGKFDQLSSNGGFNLYFHTMFEEGRFFDYEYGIEGILRESQNSSFYVHQFYLNLRASIFTLRMGKQEEQIGSNYHSLSSGSMAISGNANPVSKITLAVEKYQPVPFTNSWVKFKGRVSHGWLEDSRFVKDVLYHDKTAYLKFGKDLPVQWYVGLVHFAQWGGVSPTRGKLPSSLADFGRVFFGNSGRENAPEPEQISTLGNQLGIWDFGIDIDLGNTGKLFSYWNHYFETETEFKFRNIGDGLYGLGLKDIQAGPFKAVLVEFVNTQDQGGPGLSDPTEEFPDEEANFGFSFNGRHNYYNHGIYRSGWTYEQRNLGNPLIMSNIQLAAMLPEATPGSRFFASTRVQALHAGVEGFIQSWDTGFTVKATYVEHYGTYQDFNQTFGGPWGSRKPGVDLTEYTFYPALSQWYFFVGGRKSVGFSSEDLLEVGFAFDTGQLTNNVGLSLIYTLSF